jgi:formylglycine-generating enzyme required for sulfatase activity
MKQTTIILFLALAFNLSSQSMNGKLIKKPSGGEKIGDLFSMVFVQGGTFSMGCTSDQGDFCTSAEIPVHKVTVSDFYIGKYEVTQAQWRAVMGSDPPNLNNTGCDECPVEKVSWDDVQEFIKKLNAKTGKKYRLPTEAEWEYAARGGNQSKGYKYSGSNDIDEVAWYYDNHRKNQYGAKGTTHPVGTKKPNELGIYDMTGNVGEWCQDWHGHEYYKDSPSINPQGPASATSRSVRGGGWATSPKFSRIAYRTGINPNRTESNDGFRLACSP